MRAVLAAVPSKPPASRAKERARETERDEEPEFEMMVVSEPVVKNTEEVEEVQKKNNRIQVSTNKKPLYFYVNLAKRYMQNYNEVELSALGMAIGTVVTVAEILKNNGLATEKKILTSTVGTKDGNKGRIVRKAKIEILLGKTENLKERKPANGDSSKEEDGERD